MTVPLRGFGSTTGVLTKVDTCSTGGWLALTTDGLIHIERNNEPQHSMKIAAVVNVPKVRGRAWFLIMVHRFTSNQNNSGQASSFADCSRDPFMKTRSVNHYVCQFFILASMRMRTLAAPQTRGGRENPRHPIQKQRKLDCGSRYEGCAQQSSTYSILHRHSPAVAMTCISHAMVSCAF